MSVMTIEKRRKRSWSLYLILCKGRYKRWITSDEQLYQLSFPTGKTKVQYTVLEKVYVGIGLSLQYFLRKSDDGIDFVQHIEAGDETRCHHLQSEVHLPAIQASRLT
ncbi:hypothetical protein TNCV_2743991 [Trichonephila clavipes]|nr:hypothetical protein TNCV_2743991 [Trichonephila clavipes]